MGLFLLVVILLLNSAGTLEQRAQVTGREAVVEVTSTVKVLNVYGMRPDATADLETLRVNLQLSAGSLPQDLSALVIRYSDATASAHLTYSPDGGEDAFAATWIRGEGEHAVMQVGDIVELAFTLPAPLAERTHASLTLIPESGPATIADFRTPPTYGSDLIITLR